MRRKDREVTDFKKIVSILNDCDCCRLGLVDEKGLAYIVPMNFGTETDGERLTLYFHCANEGKKLDIMRANSAVSFEADTKGELTKGDIACAYSYNYRCAMGEGKAEILTDSDEKRRGLNSIMRRYSGKSDWEFLPEMLERVCVIRVRVDSLSCKEHI